MKTPSTQSRCYYFRGRASRVPVRAEPARPESFAFRNRADAVGEFALLPRHYAGEPACKKCHAQQASDKAKSGHSSISCESCHGALLAHAESPKSADSKPRKPKEAEVRAFCGNCHGKSVSRPAKFPQVDLEEHNRGMACNQCHQPHRPK